MEYVKNTMIFEFDNTAVICMIMCLYCYKVIFRYFSHIRTLRHVEVTREEWTVTLVPFIASELFSILLVVLLHFSTKITFWLFKKKEITFEFYQTLCSIYFSWMGSTAFSNCAFWRIFSVPLYFQHQWLVKDTNLSPLRIYLQPGTWLDRYLRFVVF